MAASDHTARALFSAALLWLVLLAPQQLQAQEQAAESTAQPQLDQRYQLWLASVQGLITVAERDYFLGASR